MVSFKSNLLYLFNKISTWIWWFAALAAIVPLIVYCGFGGLPFLPALALEVGLIFLMTGVIVIGGFRWTNFGRFWLCVVVIFALTVVAVSCGLKSNGVPLVITALVGNGWGLYLIATHKPQN